MARDRLKIRKYLTAENLALKCVFQKCVVQTQDIFSKLIKDEEKEATNNLKLE
jgi:hypothetical protein